MSAKSSKSAVGTSCLNTSCGSCPSMQFDIVGDVRGSHFMMALEFVKDRETKQNFDDEVAVGMRVSRHAQARGLIVRPLGSMIVLSPPLILSKEQIADIGRILSESIEAVTVELKSERN